MIKLATTGAGICRLADQGFNPNSFSGRWAIYQVPEEYLEATTTLLDRQGLEWKIWTG